jgi:hypothetical protein
VQKGQKVPRCETHNLKLVSDGDLISVAGAMLLHDMRLVSDQFVRAVVGVQ